MWFTFAIIAGALVVAGLSIWYERRERDAASDAPAQPQSVNEWLHSRAHLIGYIGIGIIAFVVLWNVGGPDITLLATAMVGILLIAVSILARREDDPGANDGLAAGGGSS